MIKLRKCSENTETSAVDHDMISLISKLFLIGVCHVSVIFGLVRAFIKHPGPDRVDPSFLVFGLTSLVALIVNGYVLRPYLLVHPLAVPPTLASALLALVLTGISLAISFYIVFNLYGS